MTTRREKPAMPSRRRFLRESAQAACGAGIGIAALNLIQKPAKANGYLSLRPPGALDEQDFLAACVRCGQCVRACPYRTLLLADIDQGVSAGTPYFVAREIPCEMCEDIPCVKACPSGALSPELKDIDDATMGIAVLVDDENCLNMQGLRCDVCYRVCPKIDQAISLQMKRNLRTGKHAIFEPVVHADECTGCGKCEHACVLEEAAIKVLPVHVARGELGRHYRFGWKEKAKAGKSLVPESPQYPVNRPEESQ